MTEVVFEVTQEEDGGFSAAALDHGIYTHGETWDELREMARDAVKCHFQEGQAPGTIRLHLLHVEVLAVA